MGKSILRIVVTILCLIIQLAAINIFYYSIIHKIPFAGLIYTLLCLYGVLMIIKNSNNYSFTLPWIIIFLLIPIPGSILFLIVKFSMKKSKLVKNILKKEKESSNYLIQDEKIINNSDSSMIKYLSNHAGFPATTNNIIKYYSLGDDAFEKMIEELKKAEKYIFFEYFIVNKGIFWESILDILEDKAKAGVEVRVMYDDFGCLTTLESDYWKVLESKGIKSFSFNPFKALSGAVVNNRDHRKILVIDGKVAFSGGINIADEYINMEKRFGHWKDNCFMVKGDAVWNYTVMFLTLWNSVREEDKDYNKYKNTTKNKQNGYLVPYGLNPFKRDYIGEDIYLNIINQASKYVYIFTPYLVIDHNMLNSLILAVKRCVDVRIVVPNIPDKKIVYNVTESYVEALINHGIKVYKYTPGFIHSKVFVSDDIRATVGTINLDYRSLFFHFECGCYMEKCDAIKDIKKDALDTIATSQIVQKKKVGKIKSFWQSILRLFAPLM